MENQKIMQTCMLEKVEIKINEIRSNFVSKINKITGSVFGNTEMKYISTKFE